MELQKIAAPWLLTKPKDRDKIRLFCLPYAGGGASIYREWTKAFPDEIGVYPIQLPGRENRLSERPWCHLSELAQAISKAIAPYSQIPFILFGHSLGAKIAFEVARCLRREWNIRTSCLVVSASRAPSIPEPNPLHHLPDNQFVEELRRLSGTPEAILQSRELLDLFMPVLRADFAVDETYVYVNDVPLDCPIAAFGGTSDLEVQRGEIEGWAAETSGDFTLEMIEGDHFFLQSERRALLRHMVQLLQCHT